MFIERFNYVLVCKVTVPRFIRCCIRNKNWSYALFG